MQHRSPLAVFFLSLITLGIYALYWEVKTKIELKRLGADIPTAWLIIVPFANLWWAWKYCVGVEKVTNGQISAVMALILMLVLGIVGFAILQNEYNKLSLAPVGDATAIPTSEPEAETAPNTEAAVDASADTLETETPVVPLPAEEEPKDENRPPSQAG